MIITFKAVKAYCSIAYLYVTIIIYILNIFVGLHENMIAFRLLVNVGIVGLLISMFCNLYTRLLATSVLAVKFSPSPIVTSQGRRLGSSCC